MWSARLSIPRDRWQDVGLAYGTKSGIWQEFLRSLQTYDKQASVKRRGPSLEALRSQVNEKLATKIHVIVDAAVKGVALSPVPVKKLTFLKQNHFWMQFSDNLFLVL
nr:hypothetical protein [uncultured Acetobacter sp.]